LNTRVKGSEALLQMLVAYDVEFIFGLCGDTTLPFYDAIFRLDHSIQHILVRDERTAAYMADGYARISGKPGVCEGPSGGGATYILPGLIEANNSSSAILAITTDISIASYGKFPLTEVDQEALMRPLTKWNTVIKSGDHIPRMVRKAFRMMTSGRPGSVHLGIPYDIQYEDVDRRDLWADPNHKKFPAWRAGVQARDIEKIISSLSTAKKPLIVCGGGVVIAQAMDELRIFVEFFDLPLLTSISGQGSLADTHPLCGGVVGSNGGTPETWQLMEEADLVIFLGCRAGSTTTSRWQAPNHSTRIIQIDSDPEVIGANYQTEVGVLADLKIALAELNRLCSEEKIEHIQFGGHEKVKHLKLKKFARFNAIADMNTQPIRPESVIKSLQNVCPQHTIIVSDPGTSCPYISSFFQFPKPGRYFITNRAHGALGYSLGAAIGAWFATNQKEIIAIMGDGSFGFSCGELETLKRYNIPITIIVLSNQSFGWIKASQHDDYAQRYHNVDFNPTNHAAIASDYGLKSWQVERLNCLDETFRQALSANEPTLVDVQCTPLELANAPVQKWMG